MRLHLQYCILFWGSQFKERHGNTAAILAETLLLPSSTLKALGLVLSKTYVAIHLKEKSPDKYTRQVLIAWVFSIYCTDFCTEWPSALDSDEKCEQHFPIEIETVDYVSSGTSIRNPKARVVTLRVSSSFGKQPLLQSPKCFAFFSKHTNVIFCKEMREIEGTQNIMQMSTSVCS